ncbi:MAG TPA: TSUP family transporter [Croceicoccus sp.]|nr:TSUP family transporter [Croceicoccus sp.]
MEIDIGIIVALGLLAVLTGMIDAVAGGGGLLLMPSLLFAGIPPDMALGVNKVQSLGGTTTAFRNFAKAGLVHWRSEKWLALLAFVTAGIGTVLVQLVSASALKLLVPLLLGAVAIYIVVSPRMDDTPHPPLLSRLLYAPVATVIGLYDGFFGPGAGSFFTASLVGLRGEGLTRATAVTKLFNMVSNLASVIFFALGGKIIWTLGIAMACGAIAGSWIGSHMAMRHGARLIRPLLVTLSLLLTAKLLYDWYVG